MLNKSYRNKIKIRSTKKKQKRRTKKNRQNGGAPPDEGMVKGPEQKRDRKYGEGARLYADYPSIDENKIVESIGFEIPEEDGFNSGKDNYKFLEMADRDLTRDMEGKLNKYEAFGGIGSQYCKYMYLIRATHRDTGNTVLHYICNHRSVEMFQLVFPLYLILYNKTFPQLLAYYINKVNINKETPLDLLSTKSGTTGNLDFKGPVAAGVFGLIKNTLGSVSSIDEIKKTATKFAERAKNALTGRASFIEKILRKFGGKKSNEIGSSGDVSKPADKDDLTSVGSSVTTASLPLNEDGSMNQADTDDGDGSSTKSDISGLPDPSSNPQNSSPVRLSFSRQVQGNGQPQPLDNSGRFSLSNNGRITIKMQPRKPPPPQAAATASRRPSMTSNPNPQQQRRYSMA